MRRRSPAIYAVLIAVAAIIFIAVDRTVPSQHLPWRALNIEAPVGASTNAQMFRLALSPSGTCMALADNALRFSSTQADPKDAREPCGWTVARDVLGSEDGLLSAETTMQCPLAIGTYIWIREIDSLARKHFEQPLKTVHHYGTYACREQRGNSSRQWSEHAFANAFDVAAFELADGQRISVLDHWSQGSRKQKRFLRGVRDQACNIFRVTLSPDYNAAHKDHFHVDMGPTSACQ